MRIISKPNISPLRTYIRCYYSLRLETKMNFRNIIKFISDNSTKYDQKACTGNLYEFPVLTNVHGSITKDDMVRLYNEKMVKYPTGRKIYDKLKSLAVLGKCPFCGIGTVTTLDHYLPKAQFPAFAVLPYNLVASCKDCNTGKLANIATAQNKQTLHPYYDDFTTEQWLFAKIVQTSPVSIKFYVNPPRTWRQVDKDRVKSHFDNYKLSQRFSIQASNVLAHLKDKFLEYRLNSNEIQQELLREFNTYLKSNLNSWETALYQALYQSQWYCEDGFD